MFWRKEECVMFRTVRIPTPKQPESSKYRNAAYRSMRRGTHWAIQFITGADLDIITKDEPCLDLTGGIETITDADGRKYDIASSQVRNIMREPAVKCGACGRLMVPCLETFYANGGEIGIQYRCSSCYAKVLVEDVDD